MNRIASGEEKALKILFEQYRGKLFGFIVKIIHSETVAEELVMDVYLKLWLGREMLPQVQNMQAFMYRIARNKALNYIRDIGRNPALLNQLVNYLELAGTDQADAEIMYKEYELCLREAVGLLTPQRKEAWRLKHEENLTHDQIAEKMQITPRTVRFHIDEAKNFIRQHLAKHLDLAVVFVLFSRQS